MKTILFKARFYLEMIAVPAFVFLVTHLAGHGVMLFFGEEVHEHDLHETESFLQGVTASVFSVETLIGVSLLVLFVWLWHRPGLKKWVPCTHDHCHSELPLPHMLATVALCLHFFPEAAVRHELLIGALSGEVTNMLGLIGFIAHFLVDVIVAIVLSGYWARRIDFWLNFATIAGVWGLAFVTAGSFVESLPSFLEGSLFVVSAFLLAMFVHKPHRGKVCSSCE